MNEQDVKKQLEELWEQKDKIYKETFEETDKKISELTTFLKNKTKKRRTYKALMIAVVFGIAFLLIYLWTSSAP